MMEKTKTISNKNKAANRPLALALEQRFMFDAAGVATGSEVAQEVAAKQAADQASENDAAIPSESHSRTDLVLIDANVSERDVLAAGVPEGADVVYLESGATLDDIANIVANYQNIDGLHIISHGGDASLNLSGETLTTSNLADHQAVLGVIGQALSADGDILLYGCNIGTEGNGQQFIDDFAEYTQADVAASDDLTGAAALGGDWELETTVGTVESQIIFDDSAIANFSTVLAISNENFDGVGLVNVNASSQTIGDWTFSLDVTDLIATPNSAEQAQNLNSDGGAGDRSLVINNASIAFRTLTIESADGSEFDLSSIAFGLVNGGTATGVSIEGFRDNVSVVSSESVSITSSDTAGNIHYSFTATTAGGSYGTLSFQSAFDNVDEIRITANHIAIMELDDIVATAAVTNSAPDLGGTPADDTATEDVATAIDLSAYNIVDADGDTITLTLAVDRGTIASIDGNGTTSGVTVATSSTSSMTLQGTVADLNTYLNDTSKITYTTASDDTTTATLTVTPNDGTVNGTADTVNITISAVNDNPSVLGVPSDVTVAEDTQSNIDFSGISFDDVDSASITVTLTASAGTFATPADGSGISVTESLSNSDRTITLVGSPTNINTYLDTASNIRYTAATDVSGNDVATISVTANDGDGSGDVNLGTVNIDVTAANDAPTVSSLPSSVTVTEDTQSNIDLSATVFADVDGDTINVTLTASAGSFATPADGSGISVTESLTNSNRTITLVGTAANINTYLDTASNIQYTAATNVNGTAAATISVVANDNLGSGDVSLGTVNIDVTGVNDAPTATGIPTDVTVTEDTASNVDLSAVTFADVDGDSLTVTLTATAGTFAATTGGGVTVGGSGTGTLTLAGTVANINTFLDTTSNVQYTGAANANGNDAATFTIQANDGTVNPTLGTVNLDITAQNDAPTATGIPTDITVIEDTASNVDLSAVTFADIEGDSLTVTLTATAGTFAATTGGGVTVGGSGTGTLTLAGTVANINTFLDTTSNVQYTGAANANGNDAATFTIQANDGTVNPTLGTVNLDITAVNDVPTVSSLPSSVTVTEDTQSNIALGAAVFADVDGDNITVTLIASAGTFEIPADGAGVGSGVVESRPANNLISLVGSAADINTYLDTASNIQYNPVSNVSGNAAASIEVLANDGSGNRTLGTVNIDVTAVNDVPVFANLDGTPTFTEGGTAQILDANVTVSDVELGSLNSGNGNFNGATLALARNGGVNTADTFSIQSGGNLTVAGSNISSGGNVFATFDTASTTGQVTISFTSVNGTTPTTALVNEVMQAIRYANSSNDPASSVTINWTFSDGNSGNAQGTGSNPGTVLGSTTVSITNVNDAPTLTATGGNPTFTEGGSAQDLFNTVSASTIESADRFTTLQLTVTNVNDGASEILSFDGSDVALANGNAVTTATNGLSVSVSVVGSTATVSFTGASLTNAQMQTLVDALTYRNTSEVPTTAGNRVVTITGIGDDGGTANSGVATAAPNLTSTVTVAAVNDTPTLTSFGPDSGNVSYIAGSTTFVAFDSGTVANLQDAELDALNSGSGNYNGATITLVRNGGANTTDRFGIAGGTTALDNGSTVTVGATNIGTVTAGSAASGTVTVTLNSSATSALVDTFFQTIGYTNSNGVATGTVAIDVTLNDGNTGTQGSGGAQSVTQQVNVTIGNPPAIGNLTGDSVTFTENGGAIVIDQSANATVTDADSPANLNGGNLSISVTGNANAAQDVLSLSTSGTVALSGTTAGSNVSVGGTVVGTLGNNIAAGNNLVINFNTSATTADAQTLVQAATYNNTSEDPTTGDRTISFAVTDDTGLSSTAATVTVGITAVNDEPTLSATNPTPTFTEGGAAVSLFSSTSISAVEAADNITSLTFTVTNVADGSTAVGDQEFIVVDGVDVALANGTSGTTAANSFGYSVSLAGSTATVTISLTTTAANYQTLVDGLQYRNTSDAPTTSNRVVTLTQLVDSGGTSNSGDDTVALSEATTVSVSAVNDAGSFSNLDATPVYTRTGPAVVLDANATIADPELDSANNYNGATLQIVRNGGADANDQFEGSGTLFGAADDAVLTEGQALKVGATTIGTVTTNSNGTLLLTFNASATSSLVDTAIQSIAYSAANAQVAGNITLDWTFSDGNTGGQGSGGAQAATVTTAVIIEPVPAITAATYDASNGTFVITGEGIVANGSGADIDASLITLTGEGGETYTLTNTADVNRDSSTQFTLVLSAADRAALNQIFNSDGSNSTNSTAFNIAVADNWVTGAPASIDISDNTSPITVSNVAAPTITSSTYDADSGVLVITGTGFLKSAGANNDIDVSVLSITGLGGIGSSYTLTDTADVDISSGTTATITLSATDKAAVNALLDTSGISASDSVSYNLAAGEDWARGADVRVNVADLTGNSITASVPVTPPEPTQVVDTTPPLNLQQQQQRDNERVNRPVQDANPRDNSGSEDAGTVDAQTTVAFISNEGQGVTSGDILTDPSAGIDALTIIRDTVVEGRAADQNSNRSINSFESTSPSNDAPANGANGNAGSPPVQLQDVLNLFGPTAAPAPNGEQGNTGDQAVKNDPSDGDKQNDPNTTDDDDDDLKEENLSPSEGDDKQKPNSENGGGLEDSSTEPAGDEPKENANSQGALYQAPRSFSDKLAHANGQTNERVIKALMFKG